MKKIFYLAIAILSGVSFVSCDDMLDAWPKAQMTEGTFFKNDSELRSFSMNMYSMFPATSLYMEDSDIYIKNDLAAEVRGTRTIASSASDGGWSWGSLRNVNTILDYLPRCSDPQVRTKYEALARFFRAYFYFDKVKRFGDVPWYETQVGSTDNDQLYRPRDSREFIMGKMIEDIDFAIDHLPNTKSAYEVTKWTAMAFKSRFLLFEGTFRKYHTEFNYGENAHDWQWYLDECAKVSEEFMSTSGYALHTHGGAKAAYQNLFTTNKATEITDEVILARNYNLTFGVYHNSNYTMLVGSMGRPGMTKKAVASYLMADGSRFTDKEGWQTMQFMEETAGRDPRLAQSIRTPGYKRMGETKTSAPNFVATVTGYQPIKYVTTPDQDIWNGSDIDLIIFRHAEILLNFAEAKAEAGTLTQADLDKSINQIRDRVGMPHLDMAAANANPDPFLTNKEWGGYQNVTGPNKGVILEIRRERTVELTQEGYRYYDIIRWKEGKIFEQQFYGMYFPGIGEYDLDGDGNVDILIYTDDAVAKASNAPLKQKLDSDIILSGKSSGFVNFHRDNKCIWNDGRDYLYPIPTDERSLTGGILVQNPGWDDGLSF